MSGQGGMTLLDWYAGRETIGDEELSAGICDHFAGPRPSGDWKTNPVGWYEWEARWRAGVKYTRASAMLAEKARREADGKDSLTVQDHSPDAAKIVPDHVAKLGLQAYYKHSFAASNHSPDAAKMVELEAANRELAEALVTMAHWVPSCYDHPNIIQARAILAKHKGVE